MNNFKKPIKFVNLSIGKSNKFNNQNNSINSYIKFYNNKYSLNNNDIHIINKIKKSLSTKYYQLKQIDKSLLSPELHENIVSLDKMNKDLIQAKNNNFNKYKLSDFYYLVLNSVETMHDILKIYDKRIVGNYHTDFAKDFMLESCFNSYDPNTRLNFSFSKISYEKLIHARPTCIYYVQLLDVPDFSMENLLNPHVKNPLVPFEKISTEVEGKILNLREMTFHDIGHSHVMNRHDRLLFDSLNSNPVDLVNEWINNKNLYWVEICKLEKKNKFLAKAVKLYLFDIVHDRGYQFYLPMLSQQISSEKNLQNIKTKILRGDFNDVIGYDNDISDILSQIDNAKNWLEALTDNLNRNNNINKIYLYKDVGCIVNKYEKVKNYKGIPTEITITKNFKNEEYDTHTIEIKFLCDDMEERSTSIFHIELLNIPEKNIEKLTTEKIYNLNELLRRCTLPQKINYDGTLDCSDYDINKTYFHSFFLKKIEIFKLERLFYLIKNKIYTNFTITKPTAKPIIINHTNMQNLNLNILLTDEILGIDSKPNKNLKYINNDPSLRYVLTKSLNKSYVIKDTEQYKYNNHIEFDIGNETYQLGIVDTINHLDIACAVSSLLTRSVDDAKDTNPTILLNGVYKSGGYVPTEYIERAQLNYVSPEAISTLWGKFGYRFVLSRKINYEVSEIIATALISSSKENLFFFTQKYNNIKIQSNQPNESNQNGIYTYSPNPTIINDEILKDEWFGKFDMPSLDKYKPQGYNQLANFAVEKSCRGLGLGKIMIEKIVTHYALNHPNFVIKHKQPLICGKGLFQIADPSWKNFMSSIGFKLRIGADTFYKNPSRPTIINNKIISNEEYNKMFNMPQIYDNIKDVNDSIHILDRIDHIKNISKHAKLQYNQLIYPF